MKERIEDLGRVAQLLEEALDVPFMEEFYTDQKTFSEIYRNEDQLNMLRNEIEDLRAKLELCKQIALGRMD